MHAVKPNNKKTIILTLKSNATNVVTSSDKTTYNNFPQRIKFALNAQNEAILLNRVAQEVLVIWVTVKMKKNKMKPNQRVKEPNSTQSRLLILRVFALRVFTNPVRQINSGTMQLQFNRWQRYRNLPNPNLILRPRGYAGHFSKGHRSPTYKLLKHLRIFRQHIDCDQ